jgi:hypothetical protein
MIGREVNVMERDINSFDISGMIFDKLKEGYGDLKEVPSKMPAMDKIGETKWYDPGDSALISFQSLRMQTIRNVEIRNFDDRQQLDLSNSFITTLMPDETYPLPLFVADVDVHKEKYVHVITDLVPLSHDAEYRKKYEEPVNQLKGKYRSLPGLINEITDDIHKIFPALREFEAFTSSGRIFGNIPIEHGPQILDLLSDYTSLYSSFVKDSVDWAILKNDAIRNEAMERLGQFLMMMSQLDFSDDMPSMPK